MFDEGFNNQKTYLSRDNISIEEILSDQPVAQKHEVLTDNQPQNFFFKIVVIVFIVVALILVGQLYSLQIAQGENYFLSAEGNRIRTVQKFSARGLITDRYGEILARNVPRFELIAIPADRPRDTEETAQILSEAALILEADAEIWLKKLESFDYRFREPVVLKSSMVQEQALMMEDLLKNTSWLQIESVPVREYLNGEYFAHLLGYVGKLDQQEWQQHRHNGYYFNDTIGKMALERVYEPVLRGKHGWVEVEVDASGRQIQILRQVEPEVGHDITLTLDAGLQKVLYQSLSESVRRHNGSGGAATVSDPRTGEILALVSYPSFDNNVFAHNIDLEWYQELVNNEQKPMLNRVTAGTYQPGSTLKPLVAAAGLQEGVITDKTIIHDIGYIRHGSYLFRGWKRDGLGRLDVAEAIARSSGPFFYVVGGGHQDYGIEGLGINRLVDYLKRFALGTRSGINLPGEAAGFVPTVQWKTERFAGTEQQNWYIGDTYHLSIGQGYLLTTPLQINQMTAGLATGKIMKPILTNLERQEVLVDLKIEEKHLEPVRRGLYENVDYGSGVRLKSLPVQVAGKTGTAQFDARDLHRTHAWYTGYAPYEDPQIAITVLIEDGGEGHIAAVPVVQETIRWWAENRLE